MGAGYGDKFNEKYKNKQARAETKKIASALLEG